MWFKYNHIAAQNSFQDADTTYMIISNVVLLSRKDQGAYCSKPMLADTFD